MWVISEGAIIMPETYAASAIVNVKHTSVAADGETDVAAAGAASITFGGRYLKPYPVTQSQGEHVLHFGEHTGNR
jgi:hypothetical protein